MKSQTQIRQKTKQEHDGGQCITSYENNGSGKSSLYLDKVSGDNIHKKILQYKQENITFKLIKDMVSVMYPQIDTELFMKNLKDSRKPKTTESIKVILKRINK